MGKIKNNCLTDEEIVMLTNSLIEGDFDKMNNAIKSRLEERKENVHTFFDPCEFACFSDDDMYTLCRG